MISMKIQCPPVLLSEIRPEVEAPFEAVGNEAMKDWFVNDYQPAYRDVLRRLTEGREWCLKQ
jgi:hypothetical protein